MKNIQLGGWNMNALPLIVGEYFQFADERETDRFIDCFASDATIRDEGGIHCGSKEIREWKQSVDKRYGCVHTVKGWQETEGGIAVNAEVRGSFPGSPIELTFHFFLSNGKIGLLEIR